MTTQVYEEAEFRLLPDGEHRALVLGGSSLSEAVVAELSRRGIACAVAGSDNATNDERVHVLDDSLSPEGLIERASAALDGLTLVVNICMPDPSHPPASVLSYCDQILSRSLAAAEYMSKHGGGAVVNHCALPVMYAGGDLEAYMSSLRGAITGVIRTIARNYGRQNVRSVGVQTALLDIPEVHAWASPAVKAVDVPVKRWGSAAECAKLIAFSGVDATYITGQILILDGGLTAGLSGT